MVPSDERSALEDALEGTDRELARAFITLKQQYDDLVERNLAGVFRTTIDGRFLICNASMARILGYPSVETLMRTPASDLFPDPVDREEYLRELKERGGLVNHEMTLKHFNGRPVHVLENVQLVEHPGRIPTIEGTLVDMTGAYQSAMEQRTLLENYRALLERVRDGIVITRDGLVVYANPAAERLVATGLVGSELFERIHPDDQERARAGEDQTLADRVPEAFDLRFGDPDGPWRDLMAQLSPALYEGRPSVQWSLHDIGLERKLLHERMRAQVAEEVNQVLRREIKEHRRTQKALLQAKQFARSIVDSSLDMIVAVDEEGRITEFNPAATVKFGYEAEEVLGSLSQVLYADKEEYQRVQDELNTHGAFAGEVRNIDRNGQEFVVFLAASRLFDQDGQLLGSMGVSRDVTQAKRDREALRASEERYRDLFENATDLIQIVGEDGHFQFVNNAWKETLGFADQELSGMTIWDLVHPDEKERFQEVIGGVMAGRPAKNLRTVFVAKDGTRVHVQGNTNARVVDGRVLSMRSIFHDITREEQAEAQVRDHVAKQRALFESSEHMFWTVDQRVALTSFNRGYAEMVERLYGSRPDLNTDPARPRKKFASPEYHVFWEEKYREAFAGRTLRFETELMDRSGQYVSNEIFLSPVFAADGQVKEVFGIGHEITEKRLAERAVRDQAARLAAIFANSANMMVWTMDTDFRITALNDHFRDSIARMYGIHLDPGAGFLDELTGFATNKKRGQITAHYRAAMEGRPQQFEVELRHPEGGSVWLENLLNPIVIDGQVHEISCLAYDITDKKAAEAGLRESLHEKEVLLKEVHHRVKNNLQVISSILNLQTSYVGKDQRMLDLLRESQDRIRSMSFIHESLYQTKNFSSIDLANYIDRLSRNLVMSYCVSGKVELETDLERVLLGLDQAIPCGLVLNELVSNALKHGFPEERHGSIRITLRAEGRRIRVRVQDDGVGFPKDFDPERDANLGLQLVHTLVDQLDATLERPSGPGVCYLLTFERIK
ncbi:MAG: PAS domain S-box protein [Flavobacteriales bacterium]|nr:PAS domain S-box protein [Flavobacteriales bacterium]